MSNTYINDTIFSQSFRFVNVKFNKYHFTDNRCGAPSHYFAYMISGRCEIVTDTQKVEIEKGDIFYIPNKIPYRSYWYGEDEVSFISLGFLNMPNFDGETYPVQVIRSDSNAEIYNAAVKLIKSLPDTAHLCARDVGTFYTLVGMLLPAMKCTVPSRESEIVNKCVSYLKENPLAKIPNAAKACAVSEAALYTAFRKASDITPNTLKNNLLLEHAKDILISSDSSVEYISDTLGFSSTSYFRKKFKIYFGITPKEMRNKYRI